MIDLGQKKALPLKFEDGTEISLKFPTKKLYSEIKNVKKDLINEEKTDAVDRIIALILSNNLSNTRFSKDWVKKNLELEDEMAIMEGYLDFVSKNKNVPN